MLKVSKISYSQVGSMLSRKIYNLTLLCFLGADFYGKHKKAKLRKGQLILQIQSMLLGLGILRRPLCFAVYSVDQKKKKKSLTAIIAAYRNIFVQLKTSDICCLDFINASRSIEQSCPTLGGNVRED